MIHFVSLAKENTKYMVHLAGKPIICEKEECSLSSWLAWLVAAAAVVGCLLFWFRDVRRVMRERKSTVESAAGQLSICWENAGRAKDDRERAAVLERSENIYRQAVELYNQTLQKPWNYLPAILMGFKRLS